MKVLHSQAPQSTYEDVLDVIKQDLKCEVSAILPAELLFCLEIYSIIIILANRGLSSNRKDTTRNSFTGSSSQS